MTAVHEEDWAAAWKRHFPVLRVGRRLVIRPTWRRRRAAPGDVVLALDPGMAFGTGLHPTTRLCLEGIERWADAGGAKGDGGPARVLDVGCGSGILGIGALLLGAGLLSSAFAQLGEAQGLQVFHVFRSVVWTAGGTAPILRARAPRRGASARKGLQPWPPGRCR